VLLGILDDGPLFIEDPYDSSPKIFEATYKRIARAIDMLKNP
jgi:protein-tyrosine-phosphatase